MNMSGIKVLVTGGAGFLGSHLTEHLVAAGAEVSVLDTLLSGRESNLAHLQDQVKFYQGDILDKNLIAEACKGKDVIVHSAFPGAICDRGLANQYIEAGTVGIFNMLAAASSENALFVYVSSISVYGRQEFVPITEEHPVHPILIYGATKLAGEFYCRVMAEQYGLRTVVLRYSDIFGPRNGRISAPINFLQKALGGDPLVIQGNGQQIRSYTYVADAVEATLLAINNPKAVGQVMNIAGDENISILELVNKVRKVCGVQSSPQFNQNNQQDARNYIIDNSLAKKILGFKPRFSVEEGLQLTLQWLKANPAYYA